MCHPHMLCNLAISADEQIQPGKSLPVYPRHAAGQAALMPVSTHSNQRGVARTPAACSQPGETRWRPCFRAQWALSVSLEAATTCVTAVDVADATVAPSCKQQSEFSTA